MESFRLCLKLMRINEALVLPALWTENIICYSSFTRPCFALWNASAGLHLHPSVSPSPTRPVFIHLSVRLGRPALVLLLATAAFRVARTGEFPSHMMEGGKKETKSELMRQKMSVRWVDAVTEAFQFCFFLWLPRCLHLSYNLRW